MLIIVTFVSGLLFGLGLLLSGMVEPVRVLGFLDFAGLWNPGLALVMGGAIMVGAPFFWFARQRQSACLTGASMQLPESQHIDRRLILGSATFGIGWGLVGICPGPGLVALIGGHRSMVIFMLAMLAGMVLFEVLERRVARQ